MLSEEEKKAIERLNKRIKDNEDYKTTQVWLTDDVSAVYTVLNMLKEKDKEMEKKNRIIDLMAEFLGEKDMGYYKKEEGGEFLGIMRRYSKEDWKQYFERKVSE